jgi:hypothetical protein
VSGTWFIVKSRDEWAGQLRAALDRFRELNDGADPDTIRECHALDAIAFGLMIEGLCALGVRVDADLMQLAGMRDISELL